jgi:hypothetical protein
MLLLSSELGGQRQLATRVFFFHVGIVAVDVHIIRLPTVGAFSRLKALSSLMQVQIVGLGLEKALNHL